MKILVTGGTVFASRFTAEYFIKKGHEVYVLNRGTKPQPKGARHIKCDRHCIGDRLKGIKFDLIADVTAYTVEDVKDLVTALSDPDGGYSFDNYVFISSSAVYPETLPQPFREEQQCGENKHWGCYGLNKLAAERYLRENVPNAYILRPPYLYGQMNNLYREAFVFECAEKGLPFYIPRDGEMPLQFFHIEDLCRFIEIINEKRPEQKVFNVGNSSTVTVNEWVKLCYKTVGKVPEIVSVSGHDPRNYFCFRDYGYVLDTTRQHELMPNEKPLETGLAEAYDWYKENRDKIRKKNYLEYIDANLKKVPKMIFDNHDERIKYYELMLERDLDCLPRYELPEGYRFVLYKDGDSKDWINIEITAKELRDTVQGAEVWEKYYGGHESELPQRMVFIENERGEKVATATAFYDVFGRDKSGDGWLHWVAVRRDHQGRGLSKPLISHTLEIMRSLGYTHAKIPTQTTSWVAVKVYLDFGFRPIPQNAVNSKVGWEIVNALTNHPALSDFRKADMTEILV